MHPNVMNNLVFIVVLVVMVLALLAESARSPRTARKGPGLHDGKKTKTPAGERLEQEVAGIVVKALGVGRGQVWRNVLVPREGRGVSETEVDVIAVSAAGIFVFECKEYAGWIFGDGDQQQWTVSYPGGHKERLYNPCWQNYAHINALSVALCVASEKFHGYVVFSDDGELKSFPEEAKGSKVLTVDQLAAALKRDACETVVDQADQQHEVGDDQKAVKSQPEGSREEGEAQDDGAALPTTAVLDEYQIEEIVRKLDELAEASTEEARKAHIDEVGKIQSGEICPACGGKLVVRNGKYGMFLGCENYPKCHYTRHLQ